MKVFFLSDLHLENGDSPASKRFVRFLGELAADDILILGGDIFDLLVGNKRVFRARFSAPLESIEAAASRGVRVHYVEGNHDFHFQGIFSGAVQIHTSDFELTAFGRRIWISHGDLIDPDDKGYRFLRAATKNPPFKAFVKAMPDFFVDFIGTSSSGASRKYTTGRAENEGTERLRRLYLSFAQERAREGFQHVLVGHSHLRDQISITDGEYLNLGFSAERLVYAELAAGQTNFSVKELS